MSIGKKLASIIDSPLKDFERIYVINLVSRVDRHREIAVQLERVGLSFSSPNVKLFSAVQPSDAAGFESIGARGCFMSHLGVLKDAEGLRNVLILEDDVNFTDNISAPKLPQDWGIFYGDARHDLVAASALTVAAPSDSIVCAHFVAFNGKTITEVARFLERILQREPGDPSGGPMHVDGAYGRFRVENPSIKTLLATPGLGYQRSSRSSIHRLSWFDNTFGIREAVGFLRKIRRLLSKH